MEIVQLMYFCSMTSHCFFSSFSVTNSRRDSVCTYPEYEWDIPSIIIVSIWMLCTP